MLHKTKFSDVRLNEMCVYCGAYGNTMDHVTSKVILDAPLPENLHKIPCRAVFECNQSFSTDEEYFACLMELMHKNFDL